MWRYFLFLVPSLAFGLTFEPGNYNLTKTITVSSDNEEVWVKAGAVLTGVDPLITVRGPVDNVRIHGRGRLEGGIRTFGDVRRLTIEDLEITNVGNAILINGHTGSCPDLTIRNLYIHDVGEGILFRNCDRFSVTHNRVLEMSAQDGIEPINSRNGIVAYNICKNPGTSNSCIDLWTNETLGVGETVAETVNVLILGNILIYDRADGYKPAAIMVDDNVRNVIFRDNMLIGPWKRKLHLLNPDLTDIDVDGKL